MPGNVTLPGVGEVVSTDETAAGQVQRVKLAMSADGSATHVPADADGLLVNLGANNDVTVTGSVEITNDVGNSIPSSLPALTQTEDAVYAAGALAMIGGVRRDADTTPVSADGDVHPFMFNANGRLKTSNMPGIYTAVTGNITANAQTVSADVSRASNVMVHMVATSLVGHNCTFEGSIDGGTTWFVVQAVRSNANTIETTTGVLAATPTYAWELSVNALTNFRVRATAHTSGTAAWRILPGAYATEPIPAAQISGTQPISGSVTVTSSTPATPTVTNAIVNSAATTNGTVLKASAGTVYSIVCSNINAAVRYLKLYNSTTVTVGTTTPAITVPVPAGGIVSINLGAMGQRFGTGICLGMTTGAADSDTGAVAAGEIKAMVAYI